MSKLRGRGSKTSFLMKIERISANSWRAMIMLVSRTLIKREGKDKSQKMSNLK